MSSEGKRAKGFNELVFIAGICVAAGMLAAGLMNRLQWLTGLGLVALPLACILAFAMTSAYEPARPSVPPVPSADPQPPLEDDDASGQGVQ